MELGAEEQRQVQASRCGFRSLCRCKQQVRRSSSGCNLSDLAEQRVETNGLAVLRNDFCKDA